MNRRLELQAKLENLIQNQHVYFQPPASVRLVYPCVVYTIGEGDVKRANDSIYQYVNSYTITFIYKQPNIDIIEKVLKEFEMCRLNTTYCSENLNHYVFTVYY